MESKIAWKTITNHLKRSTKSPVMTRLRKTNYCIAKLIMRNINYNKLKGESYPWLVKKILF